MRLTSKLSTVFALLVLSTSAMAQGKLIVDPNISRLPSVTDPEASITTDKRLLQKMTYDGGYKRLKQVIDDLSKTSGVRLYCGKNTEDWQVQDIPVIVYAEDMPLGKLLRAVADGTHTQFTRQQISSKDHEKEPSYWICRNKRSVDGIVDSMKARYYAKFTDAEWGWDALASFGSNMALDRSKISVWARGFSTVLAYLGEEGKKKVFSGQSVIVNSNTAPQIADALRILYKQNAPKDSSPEDLELGEMKIALEQVGENDLYFLIGGWKYGCGYPIPRCATTLSKADGFNLPPRPPSELPKPEEDCPKDRLHILKTAQDWDLPSLKMKINMKAPEGKARPSYSDAVAAIAKASGFNIVCEDFLSQQKDDLFPSAQEFFVGDTTLGDALKKLNCYKPKWLNNEHGTYEPTWLINEEGKLLIGWADEWREHHYYLVPEKLISSVRGKMDSTGAEIDDLVPVVNLCWRQRLEWIKNSPDDLWRADFLWQLDNSIERSGWRLYAALSDSDKALVKSEAGLSLSKFDSEWLLSFFKNAKFESAYETSDEQRQKAEAEIQVKKKYLTDPELIKTCILRIHEIPPEHNLEMIHEENAQKVVISFDGMRGDLPLYSPKHKQ